MIKETVLWKNAFSTDEAKLHCALTDKLISSFLRTRELIQKLVDEIPVDLPLFTVHDISHIDALWEIGSEITGKNIELNPVEGYILGCAFLLHDSAMSLAAYPEGLNSIKNTKEWQSIYSRLIVQDTVTDNLDKLALEIFLRDQHAKRAATLPKLEWKSRVGSYFLIEDADLRNMFGEFIGEIAASHWWDHLKLEQQFKRVPITAPYPFPSNWSIDLLKIACILRVADAAQIDNRRAPSFLWSLRSQRQDNISRLHWSFQNKLTRAIHHNESLLFSSLVPFEKEEAKAWWLLYDTLIMIDKELRYVDDILERNRGIEKRFQCRKVYNIDNVQALKQTLTTSGWEPFDTRYTIDDISSLIERLGGEELYGNDYFITIREIVQNAIDAIRLRSLVDNNFNEDSAIIKINAKIIDDEFYITIEDNGIGMSEIDICDKLLSFGRTAWNNDEALFLPNAKLPPKNYFCGQFGIGFFAIFMIAKHITLSTKRFNLSSDQTLNVEFNDGLHERPILSYATHEKQMATGGTKITIQLNKAKLSDKAYDYKVLIENLYERLSTQFPSLEYILHVTINDKCLKIDGRKWLEENPKILFDRIESNLNKRTDNIDIVFRDMAEKALSKIEDDDGNVWGRAALTILSGKQTWHPTGAIISNGSKVGVGRFRGIMRGVPIRAARDEAVINIPQDTLKKWASEQAKKYEIICKDFPELQRQIASLVNSLYGNVENLKIIKVGEEYYTKKEFLTYLASVDDIYICSSPANGYILDSTQLKWIDISSEKIVICESGTPDIFLNYRIRNNQTSLNMEYHKYLNFRSIYDIILDEIVKEFKIIDTNIAQLFSKTNNHNPRYGIIFQCIESDNRITKPGYYLKRNMSHIDIEKIKFTNEHNKMMNIQL